MLRAGLTDNRKAVSKLAGELSPGDCFIYDHMLCMAISAYEFIDDSDTKVYGVILQNKDPDGTIGYLVDLPYTHMVEPVEVEAEFTIVK